MLAAAAGTASAQIHCTATFRLDDAVTLGALQLDVDYPQPQADFDGSGSSVNCTNHTAAFPNYLDDDAGTLTLAYVAFGSGFGGPSNLASCEMTNIVPIIESDLAVTVTDAVDAGGNPVPTPAISVSLFCDGDTTTTVSTSTTTTTLPNTEVCTIRVRLDDAVTVGSLQVELDYSQAAGDFMDTGSSVDCSTLAGSALGTYFDNDTTTVGAALISLSGFTGPTAIYQCAFLPNGPSPTAGDFTLTVVDAGDTDSDPLVPTPAVSISAIDCVDPNATTTTTSTTVTTTSTSTTLPGAMCGDADLNTIITASDAQRILHAAVGLPVSCPGGVCDTSGDGLITVGDAQRVLRSAVGLPSQLLCL